jgi:hypothetical protein
VIAAGVVDHLRQVSDFAGTYVRIQPEVGHGQRGADLSFQNEHGVVLYLTRLWKTKGNCLCNSPASASPSRCSEAHRHRGNLRSSLPHLGTWSDAPVGGLADRPP